MSAQDNEIAVRRFAAALNSDGDLESLDEICTSETAQTWRNIIENFAFSDRVLKLEDVIADDTRAAALFTITGIHDGEFAGVPATGKRTSNGGSTFFYFEGEKISDVISYYDAEGLFRQLGATITPST